MEKFEGMVKASSHLASTYMHPFKESTTAACAEAYQNGSTCNLSGQPDLNHRTSLNESRYIFQV